MYFIDYYSKYLCKWFKNYTHIILSLLFSYIFSVLIFIFSLGTLISDASLTEDPSSWPGHLQPLGTGRPIKKIEEFQGFPEPDGKNEKYLEMDLPIYQEIKGELILRKAVNKNKILGGRDLKDHR